MLLSTAREALLSSTIAEISFRIAVSAESVERVCLISSGAFWMCSRKSLSLRAPSATCAPSIRTEIKLAAMPSSAMIGLVEVI